jgi:hypothetical protein
MMGWTEQSFGYKHVPAFPAFVHGVRYGPGSTSSSRGDTDDDATGMAHGGEELCTVEHEMRRMAQEKLVLIAGGFALHGVHHNGSTAAS